MDRRAFIRGGVLVPLAMAMSLGAACAASGSGQRSSARATPVPRAATAPRATATAVPQLAPAPSPALIRPLAGQHALTMLSEFVGQTDSQVTAEQIEAWLATRLESERAEIEALNRGMAEKGFSDYRDPRVFAKDNTIFYGIGNVDGRNACAPFWVDGKREALVEGPAMVGLTIAAKDWGTLSNTSTTGVTAAQGLMPVGTIHRDMGAQFDVSFPYPYVYRTPAGQVSLHYKIGPAHPTGFVGVEAKQSDGTVLLRQDYELREG